MKVLYLHQYFRSDEMTGGTRSYEIARRLVEFGVDVTVITSSNHTEKYYEWHTAKNLEERLKKGQVFYSKIIKSTYERLVNYLGKIFIWASFYNHFIYN